MNMKKKIAGSALVAVLAVNIVTASTSLKDGDKEVINVNGTKHTNQQLFDQVKYNAGYTPALEVLDSKVLEAKYKDDKRLSGEVESQYKEKEDALKQANSSMSDEFKLYGVSNKEQYITKGGIRLAALRKLAAMDQAQSAIFSKQEMDYVYNNYFSGTGEIFHILISPQISGTKYGDETEINKAKSEALKQAQTVIREITDKKISFGDAVKKYSANKINDTGSLGSYDVNSARSAGIDKGLVNAAFALKNEEVSAQPIETEQGYEIVMVKYSKEKAKYEDIEKDVAKKLYDIYNTNNPNIQNYALDLFRSDNKIAFSDNAYSKQYANSVIQNRVSYQQYDPNNANNFGY